MSPAASDSDFDEDEDPDKIEVPGNLFILSQLRYLLIKSF